MGRVLSTEAGVEYRQNGPIVSSARWEFTDLDALVEAIDLDDSAGEVGITQLSKDLFTDVRVIHFLASARRADISAVVGNESGRFGAKCLCFGLVLGQGVRRI